MGKFWQDLLSSCFHLNNGARLIRACIGRVDISQKNISYKLHREFVLKEKDRFNETSI